jgi:hypothetical protein
MTGKTENEEINSKKETKTTMMEDFNKEFPAILAELSFFILPFIVI